MKNLIKIFITVILTVVSWNTSLCQTIHTKDLKKFKKDIKEIVFVSPDIKEKDTEKNEKNKLFANNLRLSLERIWRLNVPYKILEEDEANKYGRDHDEVLIAEFNAGSSSKPGPSTYRFRLIQGGTRIVNPVMYVHLGKPILKLSESDMVYAINLAQFMFENVEKFESIDAAKESVKLYGSVLESKTLLIPNNDLDKKLTEEEIKKVYPYKYKIVSSEEIDNAILNKSEEYIVTYEVFTRATARALVIYQPSNGAIIGYGSDLRGFLKSVKNTK